MISLYLLGQLGLALAAGAAMALIQKADRLKPRPPWHYYLSIWAVGVLSAIVFCQPYLPLSLRTPESPSLLRLAVGIMLVSATIRYVVTTRASRWQWLREELPLTQKKLQWLNLILFGLVMLLMGGAVASRWREQTATEVDAMKRALERKIERNQLDIQANRLKSSWLVHRLLQQHQHDSIQIADLKAQNGQLIHQVKQLRYQLQQLEYDVRQSRIRSYRPFYKDSSITRTPIAW